MPGGAKGVALKLNWPKIAACAEREGLRRAERRRLRVIMAWGDFFPSKMMGSVNHSCINRLSSDFSGF